MVADNATNRTAGGVRMMTSSYRREAQGKLMNIRLANALFLDEWMHERAFDPEFNTDAVVQAQIGRAHV